MDEEAGCLGLPRAAEIELARRLGGDMSSGDIQVHYDNDGNPRKVKVTRVWRVEELEQEGRLRAAAE